MRTKDAEPCDCKRRNISSHCAQPSFHFSYEERYPTTYFSQPRILYYFVSNSHFNDKSLKELLYAGRGTAKDSIPWINVNECRRRRLYFVKRHFSLPILTKKVPYSQQFLTEHQGSHIPYVRKERSDLNVNHKTWISFNPEFSPRALKT